MPMIDGKYVEGDIVAAGLRAMFAINDHDTVLAMLESREVTVADRENKGTITIPKPEYAARHELYLSDVEYWKAEAEKEFVPNVPTNKKEAGY